MIFEIVPGALRDGIARRRRALESVAVFIAIDDADALGSRTRARLARRDEIETRATRDGWDSVVSISYNYSRKTGS